MEIGFLVPHRIIQYMQGLTVVTSKDMKRAGHGTVQGQDPDIIVASDVRGLLDSRVCVISGWITPNQSCHLY